MSLVSLFLAYVCDCCGEQISGRATYRAGLLMCPPCAAGEHRHARTAAAA